MRVEIVMEMVGRPGYTPDEEWYVKRDPSHHYSAGADWALEALGRGNGRKCLVVGSPVFEAVEIADNGWNVTYLDVRDPPLEDERIEVVKGDATLMPLASSSFDAASSTCVLCHAGMGRYGDEQMDCGDLLMLAELQRVLKKGAMLAVTFGPVQSVYTQIINVGSCHRVYSVDAARMASEQRGFKVEKMGVFDLHEWKWLPEAQPQGVNLDRYYLMAILRKE
jgi:hypothetical protein